MNATEVRARYEIQVEQYVMRIQIESRVLGDIARNHIIPTAVKYQNTLINPQLKRQLKNYLKLK